MKVLIVWLFRLYTLLLLLRIIFSWLKVDSEDYPVVNLVYRLTEPPLESIRRVVDTRKKGYDLSPLLAILLIWLLTKILLDIF